MNRLLTPVFAVAVFSGGFVSAQTASTPSPLSPIYTCAEKTDAVERLACFDGAVAQVKAAEARSEIVALDQPRVAAVRREAFGFRIPSLPRFGLPVAGASSASTTPAQAGAREREPIEDMQTFSVVRVGQSGGKVALYFDNGSVWNLVEAEAFNAPRERPFNVRIRTASMGSFILSIEGKNRGYRVRRIE